MALIKCMECGIEVSDKAEKCPKCAYPINTQIKEGKIQTIELTSKKYKIQLVLSVLLLSLGLFISLAAAGLAAAGGGGTLPALLAFIGIPSMVVGLIWYIITKIRIWWHHE